jgi:ABC-type transport system involved in multi-copper enzyme maturation permease subunit
MSTRRWGMWLAFGLLSLLYVARTLLDASAQGTLPPLAHGQVWEYAGRTAYMLNLFMPVVGGIVAADRIARDVRLGVAELQHSTPTRRWPFVLGKYAGVLLSLLTPQFLILLLLGSLMVFCGMPPVLLLYTLVAFLAIVVPAYAFITIFSLAFPLIMPLRVYQVLFTGYWLWGNYLDPRVFPTISDTLLVACGKYAYEGFFGGGLGGRGVGYDVAFHTPLDATLNLMVLAICIVAALIALERYLAWQARSA